MVDTRLNLVVSQTLSGCEEEVHGLTFAQGSQKHSATSGYGTSRNLLVCCSDASYLPSFSNSDVMGSSGQLRQEDRADLQSSCNNFRENI